MRTAIAAAVVGMALIGSSPALAGSYTIANANLRSSPLESPSTLLVTLPRGTEVRVVGNQFIGGTRWFEVTAGSYSGWVRADLIHFVPAEAASEPDAQSQGRAAVSPTRSPGTGHTITAANLRSAPRIAGATYVRTLPPGTETEILGEEEVDGALWYRVSTQLGDGWVRADLVEPHVEPVGEETQPEVGGAPHTEPAGEEKPPGGTTEVGELAPGRVPPAEETPTPAAVSQLAVPSEPQPPAAAAPEPPPTPAGKDRAAPRRPAPADAAAKAEEVGFGVTDAQAALQPGAKNSEPNAPAWPFELLRSGQVFFAALVLVVGLVHAERRLEQRLARHPDSDPGLGPFAHVDRALGNKGIRKEYDRLLNALYAIERLLVSSGSSRSAFAQLGDLVAAVNTSTDQGERIERLEAIKLKMLQTGVLPALSRAFGGLEGYAFTPQLRDEMQAFLRASGREIEERFEQIREGTKAAFDELSRRLVPDLLHGAALTFLFSRRLDLLEVARATAASAASRGWTARDLDGVRQVVVIGLFQRVPLRGGR